MLKTILLLISTCFLSVAIVRTINKNLSKPYMDEIFHVDQMQRYCAGNFSSWNEKITTPPGLYYISLAIIKFVGQIWSWIFQDPFLPCDVHSLRMVNCLFVPMLTFVVIHLQHKIWMISGKTLNVWKSLMVAFNVVNFPVLLFTSILFYTDLLSLLTILLSLLLIYNRSVKMAAIMCAYAVFTRQTNIVWAAFIATLTIFDHLWAIMQKRIDIQRKKLSPINLYNDIVVNWQRSGFFSTFSLIVNSVLLSWPFILLAIVFSAFILLNDGIALGDKSAHTIVFHAVQLFYFFGFTLFFGLPMLFHRKLVFSPFRFLQRRPYSSAVILLSIALTVHLFTYDHPFLLADNRHYTFYIWKRWFTRHWMPKYLLVPVYFSSAIVISHSLTGQSSMWTFLFIIATIATTVPNRLVEFRYFIVPYVIWRLHVDAKYQSWSCLFVECLLYCFINVASLWLFLNRPFVWIHVPDEMQRFMW